MSRVALATAAMLAAAVLAAARGSEEREPDDDPAVTVTGHGKITATPDVADISVGVLTQGPTAKEAMAANNHAMAALLGVLKEWAIEAKDVQTTHISITPQYTQPAPPEHAPKIVGYHVSNSVRVTARDLNRLGQVLDAVVKAGGNQMHGITFRFDDAEKLMDRARKLAMADARRKAELFAAEAGVALGTPLGIHEGAGAPPPPRPMMLHALGRGGFTADASVPISPGEQELSASVVVSYKIQPARQ